MMMQMKDPGRARLIGAGMLGLVFLVGALTGAAFDRLVAAAPTEEAVVEAAAEQPDCPRDETRRRLSDVLDMTPEQREQLASIREFHREESDRIVSRVRGDLQAVADAANERIRAMLTPEQAELFDRYLAERLQRSPSERNP